MVTEETKTKIEAKGAPKPCLPTRNFTIVVGAICTLITIGWGVIAFAILRELF